MWVVEEREQCVSDYPTQHAIDHEAPSKGNKPDVSSFGYTRGGRRSGIGTGELDHRCGRRGLKPS
ncbi:hypothetical protein WH47_02475 [Habropoda laboriosa]|uniref:Uncharacterized protein n=1 Tax=Habropoda laboriosa TaxID=597456 RepID=A0A0L7QJQ9_9HYME|nr:hypothetical protein WH47_02475 [Habropoda laboriosa]